MLSVWLFFYAGFLLCSFSGFPLFFPRGFLLDASRSWRLGSAGPVSAVTVDPGARRGAGRPERTVAYTVFDDGYISF